MSLKAIFGFSLIPENNFEMSRCHLSKTSWMSLEIVLSARTISMAARDEGGSPSFLSFAQMSAEFSETSLPRSFMFLFVNCFL